MRRYNSLNGSKDCLHKHDLNKKNSSKIGLLFIRIPLFNNYSPKARRRPRRSRGEYSPIITEPEANNCFSINTQVIIPKTKRKSIVKHENVLFHQKRANNWQPFCLSR